MHFTIPIDASTVTVADIVTQLTALNLTGNVISMCVNVAPDVKVRSAGKNVGCRLIIDVDEEWAD